MDLENIWKNSSGNDKALERLLQQRNMEKLPSKLPLQKLKKTLLASLVWALLITVGYVVLFFYVSIWQVRLALVIMTIANSWIIYESWLLYKNTPATISAGNNLKQELQKNYNGFQAWWRIQEKVSLFIYPIAVSGGFILGGQVGSGKPVEAFLYNQKMLMILAICILVIVPLCYLFARWIFNYAYGKQLNKIKALLDELEQN